MTARGRLVLIAWAVLMGAGFAAPAVAFADNVTITDSQPESGGSFNGQGVYTPVASDAYISYADLANELASGNVTITTGGSSGTVSLGVAGQDSAFSASGDHSLTLAGSGNELNVGVSLTSGSIALDGPTTVAGPVSTAGGQIYDGNVTLGADSTLTAGGALSIPSGNTVSLGPNTLTIAGSGGGSIGAVISGQGALTDQDTGTVVLAGQNQYDGRTTVSAGTLQIGNYDGVPLQENLTVSAPGTLDLNGYSLEPAALDGDGTITNSNTQKAIPALTVHSGDFSGTIGGPLALGTVGNQTLTLSGVNSYTGGSTFDGPIDLGAVGAIPTDSTVDIGARIDLSGFSQEFGELGNAGGGAIVNTSSTPATLTINTPLHGGGWYAGLIQGNIELTKTGPGLLQLNGAGNTYTGRTLIDDGTVQLMSSDGLPSGTNLTVDSPGTFDLDGSDQQLHSLNGDGTVTSGSATVTGGVPGESLTVQAGRFTGALTGLTILVKAGTGTFTLSGTNTYSGATEVQGGTLSIASPAGLGQTSQASVQSGATLNFNNVDAGNTWLGIQGLGQNSAGALTATGNASFEGTVNVDGPDVRVGGSGTLTLSGTYVGTNGTLEKVGSGKLILKPPSSTYPGPAIITRGVLQVDGPLDGAIRLNGGALMGRGTTADLRASENAGGTVAPGDGGRGVLSVGSLTLGQADTFAETINGPIPGTGYDQLDASGPIKLGGSKLRIKLGYSPPIGRSFTIIKNHSGSLVRGTFANLANGDTTSVNHITFRVNYNTGKFHDVVLTHVSSNA